MSAFNIDKTFNIDAEIEKGCRAHISHIWDEDGNCLQGRLTIGQWMNVKAACESLLKDDCSVSATTECGLTVYRGKI